MSLRRSAGYALCLLVSVLASAWLNGQERGAPNRERHFLYDALPGKGSEIQYGGTGILVFDVTDPTHPHIVKRIHTWDNPAWQGAEPIRGINASESLGLLFVSTSKRIAAFDLMTDKKVWEVESYETVHLSGEACCDQMSVSKDGKTIYVPSDDFGGNGPNGYKTTLYVVDAATGKLIKAIRTPDTVGGHNSIVSLDGTRVYMSAKGGGGKLTTVVDTKTNNILGLVGPFTDTERVFTIDGSGTYLYQCMVGLLGFEVADLKSGKMINRVEVQGFGWRPERVKSHGTPSHGIALTPDEKEVWVADDVNHYVHVFDNTVMPPKQKVSIAVRDEPTWITFGIDGKYGVPGERRYH